jgi:hypothetical protein
MDIRIILPSRPDGLAGGTFGLECLASAILHIGVSRFGYAFVVADDGSVYLLDVGSMSRKSRALNLIVRSHTRRRNLFSLLVLARVGA